MKICVITSLYKPYSKGGAEQVVQNIADGLVEKGNEVVVVTTRPRDENEINLPFTPSSKEGGFIKIIRFYPWNLFWFGNIDKKPMWLRLPWHIIDVFNLHSYFKIKKILKEEKPDIVMTDNLKGIGYTLPVAIRACEAKHIHTVHDVQLVEPSGLVYQCNTNIRMHTNYTNIYEWVNKKLFGSPDIVVSPSEWLMNFYTKKGFFKNSKKIVMRNPVPKAPPFVKGGKGGFFSEKFCALNLLYIGQIEVHKGIFFLIDVVKNLANVHLDIVGAGTKLEEIQKLAKGSDNIKIHGYVENNLMNTFFVQSDFLIVPSLCAENAPTVIYESFTNGVPVIASNVGGIPELVKNEYNGYIFEAGNEKSLNAVIQKCIAEKNKWDELRQNALRSVEGWGIGEYIEKLMFEIKF